jgi:hypothetical protein
MPELIPLAVRIAVRNAVGGWGPYTLAAIHDLFNSYGFVERAEVDDAGGARRTLAEKYQARIDFADADQARRYLELVDEVLENYPEGLPEHDPVGKNLRLRLRQARIGRGLDGRLELPGAQAEAEQALEASTEGIWIEERIRVFISHTSAHRAAVAQIASHLNRFAFSSFVAHDAIEPTREWQEVIELALRSCDVLVAYVTPDFAQSQWTDQEVGWALGRGAVVVPVKMGADPYGFLGTYQAVQIADPGDPRAVATAIVGAIAVAVFRRQRLGADRLIQPMATAVAEAFCRCATFEDAARRFELLRLVPPGAWTEEQLARLEEAVRGLEGRREAHGTGSAEASLLDGLAQLLDRHRTA